MKDQLPTVTITIPTYNAEDILVGCLESIKKLDYPMQRIEIIVVDGGSKDKTTQIADSYNALVISERTGRPEAATAIGYRNAKNDLIVNLPADNIIPNSSWLKQMVEPFIRCDDIVAAQTLRYSYNQALGLLDRYFALFGAGDPLAYYLGKRDRLSWKEEDSVPFGKASDLGPFFLVELNSSEIPTIGANGYIVRRAAVQRVIRNVLDFFHVDSNVDMIRNGYNRYAIVKTSIIHRSGEKFLKYFQKRLRYSLLYFRDKQRRRYHLYDSSRDKAKLLRFIFFPLMFPRTTYDAIKGYRKIRDKAWFLNPLVYFGIIAVYAIAVFMSVFGSENQ
jgi:glycosyltransferase involved in cell wall biosynthesis